MRRDFQFVSINQTAKGTEVLARFYEGEIAAENETDEMFGADRLEALLESVGAASPDDVLLHVEKAVEQFRGSRELFDDLTLMAVKVG